MCLNFRYTAICWSVYSDTSGLAFEIKDYDLESGFDFLRVYDGAVYFLLILFFFNNLFFI